MSTLALTKILEDWGLEGVTETPAGPHVYRDALGQITCLVIGQPDKFVWQTFFNHRDSELFSVAYSGADESTWDNKAIGAVRFPQSKKALPGSLAAIAFRESIPHSFPTPETAFAVIQVEDWLRTHQFVIPAGL